MKSRREFQLIHGYRQSPDKPVQPRAALARESPYSTRESIPRLLREQVEDSLAEALTASEQRLSALLHDRSRIGRELHDSVLQALYAISLSLAQPVGLRRGASGATPHSRDPATDQLNRAIQDIRRMILRVESGGVDPFRLVNELKTLSQTIERTSALRVLVEVDPMAEEILTGEEARELVTIVREALNNSVRHARATRVTIALRRIGSRVRLRIRDNGSGFDITQAQAKGLGFAQMEDQIRKVGGRLNIQSTVGRGTCITADVYLEPALTTL